MPLYNVECLNGHKSESFVHTFKDWGTETLICQQCGHTMAKVLSMGKGLLFFEEGRGRWIQNLGHEPVYVTTYAQHERLMKERGVAHATKDDLLHNNTRRALDARPHRRYLDGLDI